VPDVQERRPTMKRLGIALAVIVFAPALALAHGGGVDKHGCHHDKKAGDYHCHKGELSGKHFKNEGEAMAAMKSHGAQGDKMKSDKAKDAEEKKDKKKAETTTKK
jgi:hypothetical protein